MVDITTVNPKATEGDGTMPKQSAIQTKTEEGTPHSHNKQQQHHKEGHAMVVQALRLDKKANGGLTAKPNTQYRSVFEQQKENCKPSRQGK